MESMPLTSIAKHEHDYGKTMASQRDRLSSWCSRLSTTALCRSKIGSGKQRPFLIIPTSQTPLNISIDSRFFN